MHFTVERNSLVKMIAILDIKTPGLRRKTPQRAMSLKASGARIFVEANETICGVEALVLREGSCRINRKMLLAILKSYDRLVNVTIKADESGMRLGSTTLPIQSYSPAATPPGEFQTMAVSDGWIAGEDAQQPSTARIGPDDSSQPPTERRGVR